MFRSLTFFNRWVGGSESPSFLAWNRNKRSIAVNLKSKRIARDPPGHREGRSATSSCRTSAPTCWSGWATATRTSRPSIRGSSTAPAQATASRAPTSTGPARTCCCRALSGVAAATGRADQPPVPLGAGLADQIGSMNMVYAILSAAVLPREDRQGSEDRGQPARRPAGASGAGIPVGPEPRHRFRTPGLGASVIRACTHPSGSTRRGTAASSPSR